MKQALIIDDEPGIRDLLGLTLDQLGFRVTTAKDGVEGVEAFGAGVYDVVFLDIHMPRMNGIEALKKINQARPGQVVVMFSSSSDPEFTLESEAMMSGAHAGLYKPFELDEIHRILQKVGVLE